MSGLTVDPASPAVGSAEARMRGSRGCRSRLRVCGILTSLSNQRHLPCSYVWSLWFRGRGGSRAQPGQVHSGSGVTCGYLHTPGTLLCSLLVEAILPLQPGQSCHGGLDLREPPAPPPTELPSGSPGPVPTLGYASFMYSFIPTIMLSSMNEGSALLSWCCSDCTLVLAS